MSRAPEQVQDPLRWCAVLALAFWLACLPHLPAVPHAYFDEVHYLPAARELLALDEFTNREHPLLGKELIALGIALFGDNPVGWRLLPTLLGTLALFGAMRALWFASESRFATLAYGVLLATGFHLRKDEINDTPGEVTLANNSWGLTGAGITEGEETTNEVYAELAVPLIAGVPYVQSLDLSLSGRYTDTDTSGSATTYKVGLNWAMSDTIRFRATHGTSFRAPALFELYLADQTSFARQRNIDPCLNLDQRVADGSLRTTDLLYVTCTNPAGRATSPAASPPRKW